MKRCSRCKKSKPLAEFHADATNASGLKPYCADCAAKLSRTWREENAQHLADYRKKNLDRDHGTGEVRGLLCSSCNKGLAGFQDKTQLLDRAAEYLSNPPSANIGLPLLKVKRAAEIRERREREYRAAIEAAAKKHSYADIARAAGVSRQAVRQLLLRGTRKD